MNRNQIFNSVIAAVCLGVMGWVGNKAAQSAEGLAAVSIQLGAIRESSVKTEKVTAEALARLERKLDETVSRREFDARLLLVESEQRKQDIRLREIDLEILKLKNHL